MLEKVKAILADQLNYDIKKINDTTRLKEDMLADSLDVVSVVEAFETEFNISLSDDEIEKLSSVKDVVDLIMNKVK